MALHLVRMMVDSIEMDSSLDHLKVVLTKMGLHLVRMMVDLIEMDSSLDHLMASLSSLETQRGADLLMAVSTLTVVEKMS